MLADVCRPDGARQLVEAHLPALTGGARSIERFEIHSVFPRPDWQVICRISFSGPGGTRSKPKLLVIHHLPGDKFAKGAARLDKQARRLGRRDESVEGLVAQSEGLGLLFYPFPLDVKLGALPEATNESRARRVVGEIYRREAGRAASSVLSCRVEPRRWVPGRRCQLQYTLELADGGCWSAFGKILRGEYSLALQRGMRAVHEVFAEHGDAALTAARPLAFLEDWNMVVQEQLPGRTLHEIILEGGATEQHMRWAAHSIAVLHNAPPQIDRVFLPADESRLINDSYRRLCDWHSDEPAFRQVFERLRSFPDPSSFGDGSLVMVHRDFHDKQVLVDENGAGLIDLDGLALGHAEIDVANFLVHLRFRGLVNGLEAATTAQWRRAFLQEYQACAQRPLNTALQRFFTARSLFRLVFLCRFRFRKAHLVPRLLQLARESVPTETGAESAAAPHAEPVAEAVG